MKRLLVTLLALLTAGTLLVACYPPGLVAEPPAQVPGLEGTAWEWTGIALPGGEPIEVGEPARYRLAFEAGGAAALVADCNRGSGTYTAEGTSLSFGPLATTKMACPSPTLDMRFLEGLAGATGFTLEGDTLVLALDGGGAMTFRAAGPDASRGVEASPGAAASGAAAGAASGAVAGAAAGAAGLAGLEGTSWVLERYGMLDAPEPVPAGAEVTLEFGPDGQVGGRAACNSYFGTVEVAGNALSFSGLGQTEMACEEPLMALEQAFLQALPSAEGFALEGGRLLIRYDGGRGVLAFAPAPAEAAPISLPGTEWSFQCIGAGGHVLSPVAGTTLSLSFDAEGEGISGSAGCNTFRADVELDGERIEVGPTITTRKSCPTPVMDQERAFLEILARAETWQIRDGQLVLTAESGRRSLVFIPVAVE